VRLVVSYDADEPPPPTFDTPLISRRYSLCLDVDVGDLIPITLHLQVPVQVIYRGEEFDGGKISFSRPEQQGVEGSAERELATTNEPPIYTCER
jgi:hypothetical protein